MNILYLKLKKEWFDLHLNDKTEDYREINGYWVQRLFCHHGNIRIKRHEANDIAEKIKGIVFSNIIDCMPLKIKEYNLCELKNGYSKTAPTMFKQYLKDVSIGIGKSEWGAPDYPVFIIKLGKITNLTF